MIRQLRIKFICINMAIVTAMLLVIFGLVFHFTREDMRLQSIRMMEIAAQEHPPPAQNRRDQIPDKFRMPVFAVDITKDGLHYPENDSFLALLEEDQVRELVEAAKKQDASEGILKNQQLRFRKIKTPRGERLVFADISTEMETVGGLLKTCVLIGVVSLLAFFGISVVLANWAVRPVEHAWQQQRQFVADASHELKTPLAVLMTNAELLQNPACPEGQQRRILGDMLTVSRQMRTLVESLLELARVENGKMVFAPLDFSEVTARCIMLFEPVYFEQGKILQSDVEENLTVKGSESHLQQVLEILLDNGVKYSSESAVVTVGLRRQGNHCLLRVDTPGEALSREDLRSIFKRFYRVSPERSRDGSYGLGLSIADSIVREHGGKIWAESRDGMNSFFVRVNLSGETKNE